MVTIVKDGSSDSRIVQFSHFSVKEFLLSNRLAESTKDVSRYHIQLEPAHTILAQACLGVLLRLDDNVDRNSIEGFPLARYAAQYWVKHAQFENVSSRIENGMDCLFDADKPHFATWLWIYNEDRSWDPLPSMKPPEPKAVPLYHAALHGFRDLVERLLAKHPEHVNAKGGWHTPLFASALRGHLDVFSLLIDHLPNVDIRTDFGYTALCLAALHGYLEVGQRLHGRGADVNARNDNGRTPLLIALDLGHVEFAQMLIGHGALIDAHTDDDEKPLQGAS